MPKMHARDVAEAAKWYERAANQGLAQAQHNLGSLYYHGSGVPQDHSAAASWFRKTADQGSAKAQTMLAELYYCGRGVPQENGQMLLGLVKLRSRVMPPRKTTWRLLRKWSRYPTGLRAGG